MKREIIVFKNGTEKEIISKNGRYYICKDSQFRTNNPTIERIREEEDLEEVTLDKSEMEIEAETKADIESNSLPPIEEAEGFNNFPDEIEIDHAYKKKPRKLKKNHEGSED